MKTFFVLTFLTVFSSTICFSQSSEKKLLQEGTMISLSLMDDLNSKKADEGDLIYFEVSESVVVNDQVLIRKGCKATGTVTKAAGSKMLGKKGELNFSIDYVTTQTGKIIKVSTDVNKAGKSRGGGVVAAAVVVNPLFIFVKGKQVKYEAGHIFNVYVDKDYEL